MNDEETLQEILAVLDLKKDVLDEADFDVVAYINQLFPNEQSLSKVDDVISKIDKEIKELDSEARQVIRGQVQSEEKGYEFIENASEMIDTLFSKIHDVQERASKSEQTVREITRDIQQLDLAKHNLTLSITTLNNLLTVVEALDSLNDVLGIGIDSEDEVTPKNPFGAEILPYVDIEEDLGRAQRLLEPMVKSFPNLQPIFALKMELDEIYKVISERLCTELRQLLSSSNARQLKNDANIVQAGCRLMESLPNANLKTDLIKWFIERELSEYRELFQPNQTVAWLDKIDHRYSWLRTNLNSIEIKTKSLFPSHWHMLEKLVLEFCRVTKQDLENVMQMRRPEITHSLYIFALQRTLAFEASLAKVCTPSVLAEILDQKNPKPHADATTTSMQESQKSDRNAFEGIISVSFLKHFDIYLVNVEKSLSEPLYNRFVGDFTVNESSVNNYVGALKGSPESQHSAGPAAETATTGASSSGQQLSNSLHSATDLFLLYKQLLKHTCALSRGPGLVGLAGLFKKYLNLYAEKVLLTNIPGVQLATGKDDQQSTATSSTTSSLLKRGGDEMLAVGSQLLSLIPRDDSYFASNTRLSREDRYKVAVVLVTASFCVKSVAELQKRMQSEVQPETLVEQIDFQHEVDTLTACRGAAVNRLVSDLVAHCETHLLSMTRVPWNSLTMVGDQSSYVSEILVQLRTIVPHLRDTLFTTRPQFTQICTKYVDNFIQRFIVTMFKCKPMNTFGAEQLLLDTQCLKTTLVQLPMLNSKISQPPPRSFTSLVQEGFGRAERIIKAVMLPIGTMLDTSPAGEEAANSATNRTGFILGPIDRRSSETFLASIQQLLPDLAPADLQKILDMKGVKRSEQNLVMDMYRAKMPTANDAGPNSNTTADSETCASPPSLVKKTHTNRASVSLGLDGNTLNKFRQLERLIKRK